MKPTNVVTLEMDLERSQFYEKESVHHKQINEALIKMMAVNFQPASTVEDKGVLNSRAEVLAAELIGIAQEKGVVEKIVCVIMIMWQHCCCSQIEWM